MMYERLKLMHDLLADDGSIYVYCDYRVSPYLRLILDDIFGKENFRREIIWNVGSVSGFKSQRKGYIRQHDVILYYTKSEKSIFNKMYLSCNEGYIKKMFQKDKSGRLFRWREDKRVYLGDLRTGNYIFENEWQSFRTKKNAELELISAPYAYKQADRYKIAVRVVDILGQDTLQTIDIDIR